MAHRFLITGGTGFLGRAVTRALQRRHSPEAVVSVGSEFDLRLESEAARLFQQHGEFTHILHFADVQGNMDWSARHAGDQFLYNSRISLNTLAAWARHQASARFIGFSSLLAYPAHLEVVREADYWNGPMPALTDHYGFNKKFLGMGMKALKQQQGLQGTMLVLGNVYGPGDAVAHVIPSLIRRMREDPRRLEVWGDGSQTRDFIYLDDQVAGILRHLDCNEELLNIGSGRSTPVREVVETLARLMPYAGQVVYDPSRPGGAPRRCMDVSRASALSGWPGNHRWTSLEEGLRRTLQAAE